MTIKDSLEERKQKERFEALRRKEEEEATQRLADVVGIPYADIGKKTYNLETLSVIDQNTAKRAHCVVIEKNGSHIKMGIKNPKDPHTMLIVENIKNKGFIIDLFLVSEHNLEKAWESYALLPHKQEDISGVIDITPENLEKLQKEIHYVDDFKDIYLRATIKNVTALLELLIAGSLSLESSDIHIEPQEDSAIIRFRIDGALQEVASIDKKMYQLAANRIKLLSQMKLNIVHSPQDGRFSITSQRISIEVRTSALPGPHGDSIVMRILNPKAISVTFEKLGFSQIHLPSIEAELHKPHGLILVTGPTGSGKTTTLYAFLKKINTSEIKIITIEDPIEYHVSGISQSQVNVDAEYTFASGLRSILRQDPDVILIGEIRDQETADIALHASLTGHLVFSTLHTNDALGAILRLIDMKLSPMVMGQALNLIIAQRLVRKVCTLCSSQRIVTTEELVKCKKVFSDLPMQVTPPVLNASSRIATVVGCKICNMTGYKGRVGIFEILYIQDRVRKMIASNPTILQLEELSRSLGMVSIRQDGFLKVVEGVTTIEEVEGVIG